MASESQTRLDPSAFGLACGIFWSFGVAVIGLTARRGWGQRWEQLFADVYPGYSETRSGIVIGGVWALLDGFTTGYTVAWLYNRFSSE